MITIEDLDKAKQKVHEAFDKYDQIGDKTTAKEFCLKQKQYSSMFDEYWSCKNGIEVENEVNIIDVTVDNINEVIDDIDFPKDEMGLREFLEDKKDTIDEVIES